MAIKLHGSPYSIPHLGVSQRLDSNTLKSKSANAPLKSIWDSDLADGLWTMQVLALWFSDGAAFTQKGKVVQPNVISKKGHSPNNPTPALESTRAKVDLINVVNPQGNTSASYLYGPDAILGPALTDLLEQYAGTGLILGTAPPANIKPLLDRTVQKISNSNAIPRVTAAYTKFVQGQSLPVKTVLVETPPAQLTREAADTAGVVRPQDVGTTTTTTTTPTRTPTPTPTTPTPTPTTPTKTPTETTQNTNTFSETPAPAKEEKKPVEDDTEDVVEEKSNTALYVGLGLLGVATLGGVAFFIHKKNQESKSATEIAKK